MYTLETVIFESSGIVSKSFSGQFIAKFDSSKADGSTVESAKYSHFLIVIVLFFPKIRAEVVRMHLIMPR